MKKKHIFVNLPEELWHKPVSPTIKEIGNTLPGFNEQYLPKIMTPDVLEKLFPYVQKVINGEHTDLDI